MAKITQDEARLLKAYTIDRRQECLNIILKYDNVDLYLMLLASDLPICDYIIVYPYFDLSDMSLKYILAWKKEK